FSCFRGQSGRFRISRYGPLQRFSFRCTARPWCLVLRAWSVLLILWCCGPESAETAPDEGRRTRDGPRPKAEELRTDCYTEMDSALGPFSLAAFFVFFFLHESGDGDDLVVLLDVDQRHALRRPADRPHVVGFHADDHALLRDQQDLVAGLHVGDA